MSDSKRKADDVCVDVEQQAEKKLKVDSNGSNINDKGDNKSVHTEIEKGAEIQNEEPQEKTITKVEEKKDDECEEKGSEAKPDEEDKEKANEEKAVDNGSEEKAVDNGSEEKAADNGSETKTANGNEEKNNGSEQKTKAKSVAEDKAPEAKNKPVGGELLIAGGTNWDLTGRKSVPKGVKNLGGCNLWGLHRVETLAGKKICTISSGPVACHSVVVDEDGQTYTWGRNEAGQLGQGNTIRLDEPTLLKTLSSTSVHHVAVGRAHTLLLTEQGRVYGCGENKMGQLGLGDLSNAVLVPTKINHKGAPICRVACGAEFSMMVDINGNLFSFGLPEYGALGHNTDGKYFQASNKVAFHCEKRPRQVTEFVKIDRDNHVSRVNNVEIKEIACGISHSAAIDKQGRVFTWGFGGYGRLGHNQPKDQMVPRQIPMFEGPNKAAVSVSAGGSFTLFVTETGVLYMCGINKPTGEAAMYPKAVHDLTGWKIRSVHSCNRSILVAADDSLVAWGPSPTFGELAYGKDDCKSSTTPKESKIFGTYIEKVGGGYGHCLAIAKNETDEDKKAIEKVPMFTPELCD